MVFYLPVQSPGVLTRILLGRYGLGIKRDDVSRSRIWPNVEVRNEAVLIAAVPDEMLAEIILDEKAQPNGVFSILSFRLHERFGSDGDLRMEHLFKRRSLQHLVVNRLSFDVPHQKVQVFDH